MEKQQPTAKFNFDHLDRELIAVLRKDGRAPISKLAYLLGVSRGTVQNRLDQMLKSGAVLGFTIRINEDDTTETVRAVMMIEVVGKSTTDVIRKLRRFPELQRLHTTNGNWDLIAEIHAKNLGDFDRILREVRATDGILNSETSILLSSA